MRILMRNTVFKTGALAGLFSCLLALAVVFSGTTDFVHASHDDEAPAITADQVATEADLEQFVKEAADAYYIDFIMKHECDFSSIESLVVPVLGTVTGTEINELLPDLTADRIKQFIPTFAHLDIEDYCEFSQPFDEVFDRVDGDWKSGSIYLFVMDDDARMLFHGDDSSIEGDVLVAEDEGGRDVPRLIVAEAQSPMNSGIVEYCWDDPDVDDDEIVDSNGNPIPGKAPGDSLKISYVVDPFEYLGINQPEGSPGIIFGSGIYPKMDNRLPECNGNGIAGDMGGMDDMDDMDDMDNMDDMGDMEGGMTAVSGGGCAIVAGSDNAPRGTMFNLLLIVSALFFTISFRRRAIDRQNGVRS